ncbi:MAG: HAMP domain-containing histidine kinase [Clostridium sp.]|nr:HAMP domain-containing histidine kinase [Clostridium sp.]MCM1399216.1 HAMP domain-containing histidine kinase [Clostridium sp.]MCM1459238.1 HAMP domain-containing histidine kinase [Bacteroides sp.]
MKRLKKSGLAKFMACLLMAVSIICAVASALLEIYMYDYHLQTDGASKNIKENAIEEIAHTYMSEVIWGYYDAVINDNESVIAYYENKFSEENSNLAFSLEPMIPNKAHLPSLSNFTCSDYQYTGYDIVSVPTADVTKSLVYYVAQDKTDDLLRGRIDDASFSLIVNNMGGEETYKVNVYDTGIATTAAATTEVAVTEANEYVTEAGITTEEPGEEYDDEYNSYRNLDENICLDVPSYYKYFYDYDVINNLYDLNGDGTLYGSNIYVEDRNYVANNGIHAFQRDDGKWCYLDMDPDFCLEYNYFFLDIAAKYDTWNYSEYFDSDAMAYHVDVVCTNYEDIAYNYYVKSDITAKDNFYYSPIIRYIDILVDNGVKILVISLLLTLLLGAYLVAAAGHGKASEELYLSFVDKIPYDIFLVLIPCAFIPAGVVWAGQDFYVALGCGVLAFIAPILLYTTAARIKVGGIFKNTICYRLLKLLSKGTKKLGKAIRRYSKALWNNLNVYGKYFGVFILVAALEAFTVLCEAFVPFAIIWILEKLVFGAILIVVCINWSKLKEAGKRIAGGELDYGINTENMLGEFEQHAESLNSIQNGISNAVAESLKSEHMKTELITNVSHDLKTPLTSIINYVDLLKKEELKNGTAVEYIEVLDRQSARLKKLIQDLIDASKASTGNVDVTLEKMGIQVIINQVFAEFEDKLTKKGIKTIVKCEEEYYVMADGRLLWRVMENLVNNIEKYAQDNSRVYVDVENCKNGYISVTFKNISQNELNITGDELMERFVRGDRSRNTEGSGLGLSIARSLMELQKGQIEIIVDGDLFKVVLLLIVG